MMADYESVIQLAREYAREMFRGDSGGHDYHHTLRVLELATKIAEHECADVHIVQLAALLHDVDDRKLSPQTCEGKLRAVAFLQAQGVEETVIRKIVHIIDQISFSSNSTPPDSLEGMCVQDADRLDAIGAIGIARAFAFGGNRGRSLYDPESGDGSSTIDHFYDKLLRLKDRMNTATGRAMAQERHTFMAQFLEEFYAEWQGIR